MHRISSTSRFLDAVSKAVAAVQLAPSLKIAHDADALEALFGEASIERVRDRILRADRAHRRDLYRLHDELARRRRQDSGFVSAGA
jgi:hypothetical protein